MILNNFAKKKLRTISMSQQIEVEAPPIVEHSSVDTKELELPDTVFIRDIENRVFQTIILQSLSKIEGITLREGSFLDHLLRRDSVDGIKGINAEQNSKNRSVSIKVEVCIEYGILIPEKAEEIQSKIAEEITSMTGLHVASVHVVFKNVILPRTEEELKKNTTEKTKNLLEDDLDEAFSNEF
uniref:Asp23/Gls24 family envelope stress response protein n=1 Tax=uncultured bacterium W5-77b TaxID=1131000 RepID=H9BWF3_9BACT|nr:hypothetical protein [uncultured bacterium W5-77b]